MLEYKHKSIRICSSLSLLSEEDSCLSSEEVFRVSMGYFLAISLLRVFSARRLDDTVDLGGCPACRRHYWLVPGLDAYVTFHLALPGCWCLYLVFSGESAPGAGTPPL